MFLRRLRFEISGLFPSCHFRSALQSLSPTTRPPPPPHQVLTSHALHRTLAVLPLPFRAIEPPEREREREKEKAISNGAFSASGYITSQTGLDKITSGIVLACNVITSQPGVKAVCPHVNGRGKKKNCSTS